MILTRAPFRVTLGGGGTDLPAYFREYGGFCLGMAINAFMYIGVNRPPLDSHVRLHYSHSETVEGTEDLAHDLARNALRAHNYFHGIEVSSMADLSAGSGLGSSAAYLVGLIAALRHLGREDERPQLIAEEAARIEMALRPVGCQDPYYAAYGGIISLSIATTGAVSVSYLRLSDGTVRELETRLRLYAVGGCHDSGAQLAGLANSVAAMDCLHEIRAWGEAAQTAIVAGNLDQLALCLHAGWQAKRQLTGMSNPRIDALYGRAQNRYGVRGGRLIGSGGGGVLALMAPDAGTALDDAMAADGCPRLPYRVDWDGVSVSKGFPVKALLRRVGALHN